MRRWNGVVVALLLASAVLLPAGRVAAVGRGYVPGQFIAKLYTEALGRLPDQPSWLAISGLFERRGCDLGSLSDLARDTYTSVEFSGLGYDHAARLLTLYRGVLNREPDRSGFHAWDSRLDNGSTTWGRTVSGFLDSAEFAALARRICAGSADDAETSYGLGTTPPLALPTTSAGFAGDEAELQQQLDRTKSGGSVVLAQRALIRLTAPLSIPPGVTLRTAGNPGTAQYASMGRLVRAAPFDRELVSLGAGATLRNVWVDGARNTPGNWAPSRANIRLNGGTGTTVTQDKISNTAGPSSIYILGQFDGYPCKKVAVTDNVITAYSSNNYYTGAWTDGVSVTCGNSTVAGNQIVDTSDVAIVLYRASGAGDPFPQKSQVHDNTILSAGNSMYGGIGADPLYAAKGAAPETHDFTGSSINGNTLWTSPNTHFDIGLVAGTRAWFGSRTNVGTGARITDNTTGTATARVEIGIAVAGMQKAVVSGNTAHWEHPRGIGRCPSADLAVEKSTASGKFNPVPSYTASFDGCIGHHLTPSA